MIMELFDKTSFDCSKVITKSYSTSFSLGIKALDKQYHDPIYAIYGFVRYADEIVDTFHDFDKGKLLQSFKQDTFEAIENKISLNPLLNSFQKVVNKYNIEHELIHSFLYSMEMDLEKDVYDLNKYNKYIYGSAEVVGLMCLRVFCNNEHKLYDELMPYAKRLGAAFQKVNFLRDLKDDFSERGRIYFPHLDMDNFSLDAKKAIEDDIRKDFEVALTGIRKLPQGARLGVYLAYVYYLALFEKIKKLSPSKILKERIRIADNMKFVLFLKSYFKHGLNVI
jgi:15-cis-phytoene synthase